MEDRLQSADHAFLNDPYVAARRRERQVRLQQLLAEQGWATTHEWVRWLSGTDAQVLLLWLCQEIERVDLPMEPLRGIVAGWRAHALKALEAENWQAVVDSFLEVHVDARLALLGRGAL